MHSPTPLSPAHPLFTVLLMLPTNKQSIRQHKEEEESPHSSIPQFFHHLILWYHMTDTSSRQSSPPNTPGPQCDKPGATCCRYVCLAVCSLSQSRTHHKQCAIWFGLLLHDWGIFRTMALHVPLPHSYNHHPPFNSFILSNSISNQFQKKCSTNNHCTLFWQESLQITLYN